MVRFLAGSPFIQVLLRNHRRSHYQGQSCHVVGLIREPAGFVPRDGLYPHRYLVSSKCNGLLGRDGWCITKGSIGWEYLSFTMEGACSSAVA